MRPARIAFNLILTSAHVKEKSVRAAY